MDTLDTLQGLMAQEFRMSRDQLIPTAELSKLGIDSLDVLQLLFKIEDTYGISIKDDAPRDLLTIADVVGYIDALLARPAASAVGASSPGRAPYPSS